MPCGSVRRGQPLHLLQRLPGAEAGRRRSVDRRRAEQVEVADDLRRRRLASRGRRCRAASSARRACARRTASSRCGFGAERLVGLHVDAVRAVVEVEVVHVRRARDRSASRSVISLIGRPRLARLLAIDVDRQLRIVRGERLKSPRSLGDWLRRARPSRASRRPERLMSAAALVEHLEREAAEVAEAVNRRRRERERPSRR